MKLQRVAMLTGFVAWMISAAAAAEQSAKPLDELIRDLADPGFRAREDASLAIWGLGESALPSLEEASRSDDPERAFRARELIRKIQLFITPDTDPDVIGIVESYEKATLTEKLELFSKLHQKRAWRQMLKLYSSETNGQLHAQLQAQGAIEQIPVIAARECLRRGDAAAAREFLEMAPVNPAGLLSLAEFHRGQGTLEQELKRAKTLEGKQGAAWRLALYRAAGNIAAAREAAVEAGEPTLAAAFAMLLGDPLPWLRRDTRGHELRGTRAIYTDLAVKRWQGHSLTPSDIEPLEKAVNSRNRAERIGATGVLFLLGEPASVEKSIVRHLPLEAFRYFESQERIPEALKSLGLDPEKPDYENWVRERIEKLVDFSDEDGDNEEITPEYDQELVAIAGFLERRGLHAICASAFTAPLENLASKEEDVFMSFISSLFVRGSHLGAPAFASKFVGTWAGKDDDRWDRIISAVFSDNEEMISLWDWMGELDPKATRRDRLHGFLALRGIGADPGKLAAKWRELALSTVEGTAVDKRQPFLDRLMMLTDLSADARSSLRLWELMPEESRSRFFWQAHAMNLSAVGRWDEVAKFYLNYIDRVSQMNIDPQPEWHASVAASLRKAGRAAEAATHDAMVEKLALGRDSLAIGGSYAYCQDYQRANIWWARAALQYDPDADEFDSILRLNETALLEAGRWKEAAAVSEGRARNFVPVDATASSEMMLATRGLRLHSDLARALRDLKQNRAASIEMLANCLRLYPNDQGISDNFFPAVRKAGLIKEHDMWFKTSWDRMMAVVGEFPDADNSANTAGWLASRACRNLGEAEALLEKALAANPESNAYLDTMAEIHFARGDRAKALEWSAKAINFAPSDEIFRRQYERFRTAPLQR